jgi:hypothetical protein
MSDVISPNEPLQKPEAASQPIHADAEDAPTQPSVNRALMIVQSTCPTCSQPYTEGTLFCTNCQTILVGERTVAISEQANPSKSGESWSSGLAFLERRVVNLEIGQQTITLPRREHLVLGRASESMMGQVTDIDLTPYNAKEYGVSRIHAKLSIQGDMLYVTDLSSTNGTTLNGRRLEPNVLRLVRNGDMLMLGRLVVKLVFMRELV